MDKVITDFGNNCLNLYFLLHVLAFVLWHYLQYCKIAASMLIRPLAECSKHTAEEGGMWDL